MMAYRPGRPRLVNLYAITDELVETVGKWRNRALLVGLAALAVSIAGALGNPGQFFESYVWAFMFYLGVTLGCLALLMLQHLTGGAWGMVIRRVAEAATRTLPLVILMFVPILFGMHYLYVWTDPKVVAADEILKHKHVYLTVQFFIVRAAAAFGGWAILVYLLNKWSIDQDLTGDPRLTRKMQWISGPGILFYCYSITFMAVDWVLSINPHWFSTMFGLLFIAGQALTAFSFLIIVLVLLSNHRPFVGTVTPRDLHDLGKLTFAFVMVWAYFSFSQFLIIWAGNLPSEIPFYVARLNGGWQFIGLALVFLHFALPFALLLSRDLKRNTTKLAAVCLFIIIMRFVDLFWLVAPDFRHGHFGVSWMDFTVPIGLGGVWLACFLWQLPKLPMFPVHDPALDEVLKHGR